MEKVKISRKKFVTLLVRKFGINKLTQDDFGEMDGDKLIRSTLYYKYDKHVATWSNGEGVIL